ncbi:hypothetical protein MVEN_01596200 [Mycena venus]|uniref:MYND-type domain-containing protein n=1 Tax=Mycena venus TaxID=2733690 RepID=A0A8H6XSQ9_9AGAR|nr:hypothetical protein MVEN_01596200 [Mycena venus]
MAVFYCSSTCQRADWAHHKALCKKQTAMRQHHLNTSEARDLAADFDAWQSAMGAMLYTWICVGALKLSKHPPEHPQQISRPCTAYTDAASNCSLENVRIHRHLRIRSR